MLLYHLMDNLSTSLFARRVSRCKSSLQSYRFSHQLNSEPVVCGLSRRITRVALPLVIVSYSGPYVICLCPATPNRHFQKILLSMVVFGKYCKPWYDQRNMTKKTEQLQGQVTYPLSPLHTATDDLCHQDSHLERSSAFRKNFANLFLSVSIE